MGEGKGRLTCPGAAQILKSHSLPPHQYIHIKSKGVPALGEAPWGQEHHSACPSHPHPDPRYNAWCGSALPSSYGRALVVKGFPCHSKESQQGNEVGGKFWHPS